MIKRYPLVTFFVLAFILSWGSYALWKTLPDFPLLFPFGPLIAALLVAVITQGSKGLKEIARRLLRWRFGFQWYVAALLVPAAAALAAAASNTLLGAPMPTAAQIGPWYGLLILFPMAMIDAPLQEETSWRGFALPGFPARRLPLVNTLVLGAILCAWHLPMAFESPSVAAFLLGTFASAVVANWLYYNANGSALLVVLYHTAANTVALYFFRMFTGADLTRQLWLVTAVTWLVAIVVVVATGVNLRRGAAGSVVPSQSAG